MYFELWIPNTQLVIQHEKEKVRTTPTVDSGEKYNTVRLEQHKIIVRVQIRQPLRTDH